MKKLITIVCLLLSFVGLSQETKEIKIKSVDIYHPVTNKLLDVATTQREFIRKADSLRIKYNLFGFILITNYEDGFSKECKFGAGVKSKRELFNKSF